MSATAFSFEPAFAVLALAAAAGAARASRRERPSGRRTASFATPATTTGDTKRFAWLVRSLVSPVRMRK